jgi:WD40 repeat protein
MEVMKPAAILATTLIWVVLLGGRAFASGEMGVRELSGGPPAAGRPDLLLQFGHRSTVLSMAISPDGQYLATSGSEGAAWLWDLNSGRQLAMYHGAPAHMEADVNSVAFTADGRHLMMTYAGAPELWELGSGAKLQEYPRQANTQWGSAILSPDGSYLLVGTSGEDRQTGRVTLWDTAHTRLLHTLVVGRGSVVSIAFSPDSRRAAYMLRDGNITVFNCTGGGVVAHLSMESAKTGPIAFHPDGNHLLAGSQSIVIFDLQTQQKERELEIGNPSATLAMDISPDGSRVMVGTENKKGRLLDFASGQTIAVLPNPTDQVTHARFTPDGTRVLTMDTYEKPQFVRVWNAADGQLLRAVCLRSHGLSEIRFAAFRPGSDDVITDTNGEILTWSLSLPGQTHVTKAPADSPNYGNGNTACLTPDGKFLVQGCDEHDAALIDLNTGKIVTKYVGHQRHVISVAIDPDGRRLLSGSEDGTARLWDMASGTQLLSVAPRTPVADPGNDEESARIVQAVAFVPGADQFLTACHDNSVILWDAATGQAIRRFGPLPFPGDYTCLNGNALAVSPDGSKIICFFARGLEKRDARDAVMWDLHSGRKLAEFPAGTQELASVAISPDGQTIAIGGYDSVLRLFEASNGDLRCNLHGHDGVIRSIQFSPDGKRILTGSADGTAKLWDVAGQCLLGTLVAMDDGRGGQLLTDWVVVTPQGMFHGSEAGMSAVSWQIAGQVFPLELYGQKFHQPNWIASRLLGQAASMPAENAAAMRPPEVKLATQSPDADHVQVIAAVHCFSKRSVAFVRLYVDGRNLLEEQTRSIAREDAADGSSIFRATIDFPSGKTKAVIAAVATDSAGVQSQPGVLTIVRPGAASNAQRTLRVLAVGISRYRDSSSSLQFADKDALSLAELLRKQEGLAFDRVSATTLVNEQANIPNIRRELARLARSSAQQDVVIVLFSGHGARSPDGVMYFVPYECDSADLIHTLLPWGDIADALRQVRASSVIFLADCCHSGAFGQQPASQEDLARRLVNDARVMVFAASRGMETAQETAALGHGVFTHAILRGLCGEADLIPDHRITISELQTYVSNQVQQLTNDQQHPHIPHVNDFDPEVVLAHVK